MRTRLILVSPMLAVALSAAACGGDDTAEEAPQPISEVATGDTDQPGTTTVLDNAEQRNQADAAPEPEPEPEPAPAPVRVPLGDRFSWCADIEALGEEQEQAQARFDEAEASLLAAQDVLAAATDELDRAEAQDAVGAAEQRHLSAAGDLRRANRDLARVLLPGARTSDDTEAIARQRAQDAFRAAADLAVWELLVLIADDWATQPTIGPAADEPLLGPLTVDEVLAAVDALTVSADALEETFVAALQGVDDPLVALRNAETPGDVLAAHRAFTETQAMLSIPQAELLAVVAASNGDWRKAYMDFAEFNADISDDEYYGSLDAIVAAVQRMRGSVHDAEQAAFLVIHDINRRFSDEREDVGRAFLIADTGGIGAFWASFAESCRP